MQPLDAEGKAVQLMRSWMTAMPGETLACVGCHQQEQSTAPPNRPALALAHPAADIRPWHGPTRGFSFRREVQPVLDKFCVGCHDGSRQGGDSIPDLRGDQGFMVVYKHGQPEAIKTTAPKEELLGKYRAIFEPSYIELRRMVRVGGLESDLHLLNPMEFHADTSELVQMLQKGHHHVQLDDEAWDRFITWIDLNAPCQGTWSEFTPIRGDQRERRIALRKLYGGVDEDGEEIPDVMRRPIEPIMPTPPPVEEFESVKIANWPLTAANAKRKQASTGPTTRTLDLGVGVSIEMIKIPSGEFVMGDADGDSDERPQSRVTVSEPFWMSKYEITNRQYQRFGPEHDSRFEHRSSWIFSEEYLGWPVNKAKQPVVRVSWNEAMGVLPLSTLSLSSRRRTKCT